MTHNIYIISFTSHKICIRSMFWSNSRIICLPHKTKLLWTAQICMLIVCINIFFCVTYLVLKTINLDTSYLLGDIRCMIYEILYKPAKFTERMSGNNCRRDICNKNDVCFAFMIKINLCDLPIFYRIKGERWLQSFNFWYIRLIIYGHNC